MKQNNLPNESCPVRWTAGDPIGEVIFVIQEMPNSRGHLLRSWGKVIFGHSS